jgi:DNA-binding IclR family transcriptional regulator
MDTLQTLARGLSTLEYIALKNAQLSVAELALELNINRTTMYKILTTLEQHGFIRTNLNNKIEIASKVIDLYSSYIRLIPLNAQIVLDDLAKCTNMPSALVIAEGQECVVVKTAFPENLLLKINYQLGSRHPIGLAAAGQVLASLQENSNNSEIHHIHQQGYAYSENVLQQGACGLYVPIPKRQMTLGVTQLGPINIQQYLPLLQKAARALSGE